jgi:hypothetical protein
VSGADWSTTNKPKRAGVYGVRGFNVGEAPEHQFEAIVAVRLDDDGELVCNLHESTSEDDLARWSLVSDCSDKFEWCEFVPLAIVTRLIDDMRHLAECDGSASNVASAEILAARVRQIARAALAAATGESHE